MLDCLPSFLGQLFLFPFCCRILRMTKRVKILNILALYFQTDARLNPAQFSKFTESVCWCTSSPAWEINMVVHFLKVSGSEISPSCDCLVNQCSWRQVTTYRWQPVIHYGFLLACQTYKSLKVPFPSESAVKQSHPLLYLKEMDGA